MPLGCKICFKIELDKEAVLSLLIKGLGGERVASMLGLVVDA